VARAVRPSLSSSPRAPLEARSLTLVAPRNSPDRYDLGEGAFLKGVFLTVTAVSGLGFWTLTTLCRGDATAVPYERCYRLISALAPLLSLVPACALTLLPLLLLPRPIAAAAATCQWLAAFSIAAYFSTLVLDLWPVARHGARAHPRARADRSGVTALWVGGPAAGGFGDDEEQGGAGGGRGIGSRSARATLEVPPGWSVSRPHGGGASVLPPRRALTLEDDSDDGRPERAELLVELGRAGKRAARRKRGRARH